MYIKRVTERLNALSRDPDARPVPCCVVGFPLGAGTTKSITKLVISHLLLTLWITTDTQRSSGSNHQRRTRNRCRLSCRSPPIHSYPLLPDLSPPQNYNNRLPSVPCQSNHWDCPSTHTATEDRSLRACHGGRRGVRQDVYGLQRGRGDGGGHPVDEGCCGEVHLGRAGGNGESEGFGRGEDIWGLHRDVQSGCRENWDVSFVCPVSLVINVNNRFCVRSSGATIMANANIVTSAPDNDVETDRYWGRI